MQKWEYKILRDAPSEDELNKLGAEGWELIAVTATGSGFYGICTYLKRLSSN